VTFEEFAALPDAEKLLVVEFQPRKELEREAWTQEYRPWLTGWAYRKRILVQNAYVIADLTDFPLYVPIKADADIGALALASGFDIRFTEADGKTLLKYEREAWAVAGGLATADFWTKVPTILMAGGTYIYVYFGKAGAPDGADVPNTWEANFHAVFHLKDDPNTSTVQDSTANNLDGTKKGANEPLEVNAVVAKGQDFDGADDYINTPATTLPANITFETFAKPDSFLPYGHGLISNWKYNAPANGLCFRITGTHQVSIAWGTGAGVGVGYNFTTSATFIVGNIYHVAVAYDGTNLKLYVNGEYEGQRAITIAQVSSILTLGRYQWNSAAGTNYDGVMDEARVSVTDRPPEYFKFEYRNITEPDNELEWGTLESNPSLDDTCAYSLSWPIWGEIVRVTEDCADYDRKTSVEEVQNALSSFFFDCSGPTLYVHTSGNDLPSAQDSNGYLYLILGFFWLPLVNYQPAMPSAATPVVAFTPQDCLCGPVYYLPYLPANAIGSIRQAVGEYHVGDIPTFDTDIVANNDGFWYKVRNELYLENARVEAKVGAIGSAYNELAVVFSGLVRRKEYGDEEATFNCKDNRQGKFKMLPLTRFSSLVYANLDPNAEGWPIPIPFGLCYNCNPTCIDTAAHKYKPSAYAIDAITAVRKGSTTLVLGVDYTVDLPNGEFTLLADPLDELVTCDLRGIKIDQVTGLYSANVSDFLWHTMTALWGIDPGLLDPPAFLAFKAVRTQTCGWWMKDATEGIEWLRMLIISCLFHLLPDLQNKFTVTYYQAGIDSSTRTFFADEFDRDQPPRRVTDTERIRQMVVLNYRFNPAAASGVAAWRSVTSPAWKTICRFDETESVTLNTVLIVESEAQATADLHEALLMFPGDYAVGALNARALDMLPTEKIILDKSVVMETGELVKVFDLEAFRLFELDKDLESCKVGFVGLNDAQAAGSFHADTPHSDHTDGSHDDGPHSDSPYEDYTDHGDVLHVDHGDGLHTDTPHSDHDDHGDHFDEAYDDWTWPHGDTPHGDGSSWLHTDTPHSDHDDHGDVPYIDATHSDHSDWWHEDSPHGDVDY